MNNEVIRSVCVFTASPSSQTVDRVNSLADKLSTAGFEIQTRRVCAPLEDPVELKTKIGDSNLLLAVGTLPFNHALATLPKFYNAGGVSFNVDLATTEINLSHTQILFDIIKNKPEETFNFTYVFNNRPSSPYFPSANYEKNGFSIGLQPTDLSEGCNSLQEWLDKMESTWGKIGQLFSDDPEFLGIDSSVAPIFDGKGSLINFIKRLGMSFDRSVTTDTYLTMTQFLKESNPRPIGLCGLMFPCLEDFELAEEYEQGNFSIERNTYLSLHSGLGLDTYPIGVDEGPARVVDILKLIQKFSNKYQKPLSVRFVSDGKAKVGDKTDFQNQYLKDVLIKPI